MLKFIIIFFVYSNAYFAFARQNPWEIAKKVKFRLQSSLKNEYLKELEKKFGSCGDSPDSCLEEISSFWRINLPKKEFCFPYTQCGFYHCMEEKYQCEKEGIPYFTKLAFPTCTSYVNRISKRKFSKKGIEWIYEVMVCLQKGLIDECEVKGKCERETPQKTCQYITKFTLQFHPGCYLKSGVGICHLPVKDQLAIWKTVSPYLTRDERQQAYKVMAKCVTGHY